MNSPSRFVVRFAFVCALLGAANSARAEEDEAPASTNQGEGGSAISGDLGQGDAAGLGQDAEDKKPVKKTSARGGFASGGSGGGGSAAAGGGAPVQPGTHPADAPPGVDWLHTHEGPDTPARHRPTTVKIVAPPDTGSNSHETFVPFRSVANAETCYMASKIFLLWQQWHFRRMNRVADNASGCANVPPAEQAKIRLIQGKNGEAFIKMEKLAEVREGDHGPFDDHCDDMIQVYADHLEWNNLSMFFKGRYMNRCAPGSTLGDDWWPRECPKDAVTGLAVPRELCSPPLPK